MTHDALIAIVKASPQEIWDILREAAYFHDTGVCSETFDRHTLALQTWAQQGSALQREAR
jgi:hypothetical protein